MREPVAITPDLTTQQLLELFERTGSHEPFEEIMRRYGGMVYSVCYKVTRDKHDAEDATQATFLTLAVRARQAKKIEYLGPWLQKVGRRVALDMTRSQRRRKAREEKHGDLQQQRYEASPLADANGASQTLMLDELKLAMRDELDKLPAKYRLPLILHYFGGMRPDDVARELKLKPSTLGVRLHRGRKLLCEAMQTRGFTLSVGAVSTLLGALVQQSVIENLVSTSSYAAAQIATGASVPIGVTPDVFALASAATRGFALARLRNAVLGVLLIGGGLAGSATAAVKYLPSLGGFVSNPLNWFRPWMESLPTIPSFRTSPLVPRVSADPVNDGIDSPFAHRSFGGGGLALVEASPLAGWLAPRSVATLQLDAEFSLGGSVPVFGNVAAIDPAGGGLRLLRPEPLAAATLASVPMTFAGSASPIAPAAAAVAVAGPVRQVGGTLDVRSLSIDSPGSNVAVYALDGGTIRTDRLVVGDTGSGRFQHGGGNVTVRDTLVLGARRGSSGTYQLTDGTLSSNEIVVADAGRGAYLQDGGRTLVGDAIVVGKDGGTGRIELRGGTIKANTLEVGVAGTGVVEQSGGELSLGRGGSDTPAVASNAAPANASASSSAASSAKPAAAETPGSDAMASSAVAIASAPANPDLAGSLVLGRDARGEGHYRLRGGSLAGSQLVVGHDGAGTYAQDGGRAQFNAVTVGNAETGSGVVALAGGNLNLRHGGSSARDAETPMSAVIVGRSGSGVLQLGDDRGSTELAERIPDARVPLVVRARAGGDGVIHGWGKVTLTGPFVQNGRVVADGFGQTRMLDFSSTELVTNTIDNAPGDTNGWFARDGGSVRLPPLLVEGDAAFTWGESPTDPLLDLVNSVRLSLQGVRNPGSMLLTLVSDLDPAAPTLDAGSALLAAWRLDRGDVRFDAAKLVIRYDDLKLAMLGSDLSDLDLLVRRDDQWTRFDASLLTVDPDNALLDADLAGVFDGFGLVARYGDSPAMNLPSAGETPDLSTMTLSPEQVVPEPGAAGTLLLIGATTLLRRRRRSLD